MKPEQQRIAIAEWCGLLERKDRALVVFQRWDAPDAIWQRVLFKDGSERPCIIPNIPDYLNDLNAMHEAEERLNQEQREEYVVMLTSGTSSEEVCDLDPIQAEWNLLHATAAQRAEALLRTIGKWQDDTTQS